MSVEHYCRLSGIGETAVREDLRANKIPHIRAGKRGLLKILTVPALRALGLDAPFDLLPNDSEAP